MYRIAKGFSLPLVITALLVLGVLIVGGLRWYDVSKQHPESQNQTSSTQADTNKGYIVIKEWGVRFKPVESLGTVLYASWPTSAIPYGAGEFSLPEGSLKITVSTEELAALSEDCSVNRGTSAPWTIYRSPQPINAAPTVSLGKIGDNYYYYFGAQAACVHDSADYELNTKTSLQLLESIKTLEVVK